MTDKLLEMIGVIIIDVASCRPLASCHRLPEAPAMKAIRALTEDLKRSAAETATLGRKFETLMQRIRETRLASQPALPPQPTDTAIGAVPCSPSLSAPPAQSSLDSPSPDSPQPVSTVADSALLFPPPGDVS